MLVWVLGALEFARVMQLLKGVMASECLVRRCDVVLGCGVLLVVFKMSSLMLSPCPTDQIIKWGWTINRGPAAFFLWLPARALCLKGRRVYFTLHVA